MRTITFLVFFSVVFTIYALVNYYIFSRGWSVIPRGGALRQIYAMGFVLVSLSYVAGRFLERVWINSFTDTLVWVGSIWLSVMVYLLLFILLIDVYRLLAWAVPAIAPADGLVFRTKAYLVSAGLAVLITAGGLISAASPVVRKIVIDIPKHANGLRELNLVMASDVHLGTVINTRRFGKLVRMVNELNPDIVVFAGDLLDEDVRPVIRHNLGEMLDSIEARYGVYAITGNHEYIGGVDEATRYIQAHGVQLIRDTAQLIGDSFWLVGREDRDGTRFGGEPRKTLDELMVPVDHLLPVILLDHQPYHLEKAVQAGVDLQLSGHTHHGQLFPFNYITRRVYEVSRGYYKKGNTHFFVSSGFGTWGPPVRTNSRSEIVQVTLRFAPL
jgi:uncharacterized protein